MNDLSTPANMMQQISTAHKQILKDLFKDKINGSFLIKIESMVFRRMGVDMFNYYSLQFDWDSIATGISEAPEYDICRMIVGVHRHHSIFLSDEQIRNNQKDENYQSQIVDEVIEKIRLRQFGSVFFRRQQLLIGDEFIYFPVPYTLFVMSVKSLASTANSSNPLSFYYHSIISNTLSALTLMESNLLNNAYPLCRGMIEQYLKTQILHKHPEAIAAYADFCKFEIHQSCCSQQYPEEFEKLYNERILQSAKSKVDFLHYGWLDAISAYTSKASNRYTIYGILAYLESTASEEGLRALERISNLYKMCHGYTHGSVTQARYPLLHYFEISTMLYDVVRSVYTDLHTMPGSTICEEDAHLLSMLDRDFALLHTQYSLRSTENFDRYYATHK